MIKISLILVIVKIIICKSIISQYCNDQFEKPLDYRLVKINAYSKMSVLTRKHVSSLKQCKEFAEEKRALAFNFGQLEPSNEFDDYNSDDPFNVNCILLMCPETNNFTALAFVKGFSYFSVYYKKMWLPADLSFSCVPTAGLFVISKDKLNYTEARNSCQKLNGSLAHVANEIRTERLAGFIANHSSVYVGLSSEKEERVWKNECNEPLSCFQYRAWGRGEPTRSHGCATLTRLSLTSIPFWQVVPCKHQLQYICEIAPVFYQNNGTDNSIRPNCELMTSGQIWEIFLTKSKTQRRKLKKDKRLPEKYIN